MKGGDINMLTINLLIGNWFLSAWQIIFLEIDESHTFNKTFFTNRFSMLIKMVLPNGELPENDDFNTYMRYNHIGFSLVFYAIFLLWLCSLIITTVISFCCMVGHSHRYLSDVNVFLIWLLVLSTIVIFVEMLALCRYYHLRHAKSVKFIFDFIFLKNENIFEKLSFTAQEKAELYRVYRLIMLDQSDFKIVYADLLNNGQLLDRIDVSTDLLKQANAKKLIAGNKKLEKEIKSTYFDLMDVLLSSLNKVSDLRKKQIAIDKNLEKLKERAESNNYVNRFAVIRELHRKN